MYEQPEFFSARWVYGRKLHRCVECRREIRPGEFHRVDSGKWDGRVETHRTCPHCVMLVRWLVRDRNDGEGYGIGELLFDLRDEVDGAPLAVARAFATAVRLQWRSRRTGELLPIPAKLPDRPPPPWERVHRRWSVWSGDYRFTDEGWAELDKYLPRAA